MTRDEFEPPPLSSREPIVEIIGLSKTYGDFTAVSDVHLSVYPGEILALLGPNGAGKTTTIRMLMGILKPTAGQAMVEKRDCFSDRAEVKRLVGYLPDEPIFYDYLRGGEILRFVGEMHGLRSSETMERIQPLMERLELADALNEYAVNYSKGMKKKLALICALLHEPRVLILDEPTNGLDPFATRTLHTMIRELAEGGTAVFFSTHLLDQAERLCDRIGILFKGKLAALGPLSELREGLSVGGSLEDVFFQVAAESPVSESDPVSDAGSGSDSASVSAAHSDSVSDSASPSDSAAPSASVASSPPDPPRDPVSPATTKPRSEDTRRA